MPQSVTESMSESNLKIESDSSKFQYASFVADILTDKIRFDVVKMNQSLFLWIGQNSSPSFDDLSLSIENKYDKIPLKTKILGHSEESLNLAMRLCKKLNKQVYVSFNMPSDVGLSIMPSIEKALYIIIKHNSQYFI